jgi:hypothetical protein
MAEPLSNAGGQIMQILLAVALMAALLVPLEQLWSPSASSVQVADRVSQWDLVEVEQPGAGGAAWGDSVEMTMEWGLFTRAFIGRRLAALAEELERLDREPDIFAKAFHTSVARSAYEALLVDASRLSDQPSRPTVQSLEFELLGPVTVLHEELEL